MKTIDQKKKILNHISRIEGQLASVKSELAKDDVDCIKASETLLSASRSFAGLRQKFTEAFLLKHFIAQVSKKDRVLFEKLLSLIKG